MPTSIQQVAAPLTRAAIFLVCRIREGEQAAATVREVLSDMDGLAKTVGFRDGAAELSCSVGIGAEAWPRLTDAPAPAELHPFREIRGATHTAVATPGDLLFHIRSERQDLCFELERLILDALGEAVETLDEVSGFRYFDSRDLLGFVDGTAAPASRALIESTVVGEEDPAGRGGSYVVVQKYLHEMASWERLSTETQEAIIGRRKADGVELPDAGAAEQKAHKTLATITDAEGEHDILRDNMPFGRPGQGEFGTYFIGYTRRLWVIESMLERMVIGVPPGKHDRILDVSIPHTGTVFFAPSAEVLGALAD